jgi:inner membrane transporter RhtA
MPGHGPAAHRARRRNFNRRDLYPAKAMKTALTRHAPGSVPVPPWGLAVAAMLSVQLGSALSVNLISTVGPAGTAWLRLSTGALIFLILARPPLRAIRRRDVPELLGLGIITGLETIAFLAAIDRIPLGTAVAIEFLGPLTVAAVRSHHARALVWPAIALLGIVLLTEPWHGDINSSGIAFAGIAAIGWAAYILLTQRIGDRFTGIGALSITVTIAAVTAAIAGIPQASGHLTFGVLAAGAGLAILLPVLPFSFEFLALRQMTPNAFGTLMALEPALGVFLGLLVLHQKPSWIQLAGLLVVVLASAAAQQGGRRSSPPTLHSDILALDLTDDSANLRPAGSIRDSPN